MASSTDAAATSVAAPKELPKAWLLRLGQCSGVEHDNATLLALIRTCTVLRDAVLQHHRVVAAFDVPTDAAHFPAALNRLCFLARRSSNLKLVFYMGRQEQLAWMATEPCITHLLVCAAVRLGFQSLTCVKEVHLENLQQTSLVPAWVTLLCPNVTTFTVDNWCTVAEDLLLHQAQQQQQQQQQAPTTNTTATSTSTATPPSAIHPPLVSKHLHHLQWPLDQVRYLPGGAADQVRQQLAALPSLAVLTVDRWPEVAPALCSSRVTQLQAGFADVQRLATHFPNLAQLVAPNWSARDDDLDALLTMHSLRHVNVYSLRLQRSHTHQDIPWTHLEVGRFDAASFAQLHLDRIQSCNGPNPALWLSAGVDAAAVARVCTAVARWVSAGSCCGGRVWTCIMLRDWATWLSDLPPLLAALPEAWRQRLLVSEAELTPESLQQLGHSLPSSVSTLRLEDCRLTAQAWPALLPSLTANVTSVHLWGQGVPEELRAMCPAATRPISISIFYYGAPPAQQQGDIRRQVAQEGGGHHVTLQWEAYDSAEASLRDTGLQRRDETRCCWGTA